jgi:hypothetical protein
MGSGQAVSGCEQGCGDAHHERDVRRSKGAELLSLLSQGFWSVICSDAFWTTAGKSPRSQKLLPLYLMLNTWLTRESMSGRGASRGGVSKAARVCERRDRGQTGHHVVLGPLHAERAEALVVVAPALLLMAEGPRASVSSGTSFDAAGSVYDLRSSRRSSRSDRAP